METKILEIDLISAQGLKPPTTNLRRLQTYAVTYINPLTKLRTKTDTVGNENPTWNDKFLFRASDSFISGETSAVSVDIFAVGYIKDFLIGTVRFLLSNFPSKSKTPSFSAVNIRRPSGRCQGVLNVAVTVYPFTEFSVLENVEAVSFRDLTDKKERRLSRVGSRRSEKSFDYSSDGGDSCTSSTSSSSTTVLRELNCARGRKKGGSNGGGALCGLMMMQRRIPFCPSDQNLESWAGSIDDDDDQEDEN